MNCRQGQMIAHGNATHFQALFIVHLKIKHLVPITVTFEAGKEWTLAFKTFIFLDVFRRKQICAL